MLDKLQGYDYNPNDEAYQGGAQSQDYSDYAASRDGKKPGRRELLEHPLAVQAHKVMDCACWGGVTTCFAQDA